MVGGRHGGSEGGRYGGGSLAEHEGYRMGRSQGWAMEGGWMDSIDREAAVRIGCAGGMVPAGRLGGEDGPGVGVRMAVGLGGIGWTLRGP